MLTLLKSVWAGLIPLALLFIALEARCGFERCFRYFGIAQLLLCAMTGIDLWILPAAHPISVELIWTRAMFVVGCQFALFYFWYMRELTHWEGRRFVGILSVYATLLSMLFFTDSILRISGGVIVRALGFDLLFQPFMAFCLFGALTLILKRMRRTQGSERRILGLHLAGFLTLFVFGCLDVFFTYYIPEPFFVSFNTFGSLAFGLSTSCILLERIMALLRERKTMEEQIRAAFRDVAESRNLRLVGESAAMVHHEVKNYVSLIKGNLRLMTAEGDLGPGPRSRLERIERSADGLENLTRGILDLPTAMAVDPGGWVSLAGLLEDLARKEFSSSSLCFRWDGAMADMRIRGDAAKLEQAFLNLLKNAREAGARQISVRSIRKSHALVVSLEDDGPGCDPDRLESFGKPFLTTKKDLGGNGLGICVAKAIIENHGGSLAFHLKNGIPSLGTGLVANAVFPTEPDGPFPSGGPRGVLVVSRDACLRRKLTRVAKNVFLAPLDSASQGFDGDSPCGLALIEDGADARMPVADGGWKMPMIRVFPNGYAHRLSPTATLLDAGLFCEMFLLRCL